MGEEAKPSPAGPPPGFVRPKPGRPRAKAKATTTEGSSESVLSVKQVALLAAYVECGGNLTEAGKLSGVHRTNHTIWMKNASYAEAFREAHAKACERIEHEIYRRGELGYDEPIVYKGQISKDENGKPLTVRKYSDTLLIFRAKKFMPEYRDHTSVEHSGGVTQKVIISQDEDWYGNDAHRLTAEAAAAPIAGVVVASEVQGGGLRPALGQDGVGVAGDG